MSYSDVEGGGGGNGPDFDQLHDIFNQGHLNGSALLMHAPHTELHGFGRIVAEGAATAVGGAAATGDESNAQQQNLIDELNSHMLTPAQLNEAAFVVYLAEKGKKEAKEMDSDRAALTALNAKKNYFDQFITAWMLSRESVLTRVKTQPPPIPLTTPEGEPLVDEHNNQMYETPAGKIYYLRMEPKWHFEKPKKREIELALQRIFTDQQQQQQEQSDSVVPTILKLQFVQHQMDIHGLELIQMHGKIPISDFITRIIFDCLVELLATLKVTLDIGAEDPNDSVVLVQVHQQDALPDNLVQQMKEMAMQETAPRNGQGANGEQGNEEQDQQQQPSGDDNAPAPKRQKLAELAAADYMKQIDADTKMRNDNAKNVASNAASSRSALGAVDITKQMTSLHNAMRRIILNNAVQKVPMQRQLEENHLTNAICGAIEVHQMVDYYTGSASYKPGESPQVVQRIRASNMADAMGHTELQPTMFLSHSTICHKARQSIKAAKLQAVWNQIRIQYEGLKQSDAIPLPRGVIERTHVHVDTGKVYVDDLLEIVDPNIDYPKNNYFAALVSMVTNWDLISTHIENTKALKLLEKNNAKWSLESLTCVDYSEQTKHTISTVNIRSSTSDGSGTGGSLPSSQNNGPHQPPRRNGAPALSSPPVDIAEISQMKQLEQVFRNQHDADWVKSMKDGLVQHVLRDPTLPMSIDGSKQRVTISVLNPHTGQHSDQVIQVAIGDPNPSERIFWTAIADGVRKTVTQAMIAYDMDPTIPVSVNNDEDDRCQTFLEWVCDAGRRDFIDATLINIITEHRNESNSKKRGRVTFESQNGSKKNKKTKMVFVAPRSAVHAHVMHETGGGGGAVDAANELALMQANLNGGVSSDAPGLDPSELIN